METIVDVVKNAAKISLEYPELFKQYVTEELEKKKEVVREKISMRATDLAVYLQNKNLSSVKDLTIVVDSHRDRMITEDVLSFNQSVLRIPKLNVIITSPLVKKSDIHLRNEFDVKFCNE